MHIIVSYCFRIQKRRLQYVIRARTINWKSWPSIMPRMKFPPHRDNFAIDLFLFQSLIPVFRVLHEYLFLWPIRKAYGATVGIDWNLVCLGAGTDSLSLASCCRWSLEIHMNTLFNPAPCAACGWNGDIILRQGEAYAYGIRRWLLQQSLQRCHHMSNLTHSNPNYHTFKTCDGIIFS